MADLAAPVNTRSKRKQRKRKYKEMVKESKQVQPSKVSSSTQSNVTDHQNSNSDCDSNESATNDEQHASLPPPSTNHATPTQNSDINENVDLNPGDLHTPSPSKAHSRGDASQSDADTEDNPVASHHRANLDEFTFMLRGIEIKDGDDTSSNQFAVQLLKNLLVLGLWLTDDDNLALVLDTKQISILMTDLRVLSKLYTHDNAVSAAILGILVHFITAQPSRSALQCSDVAVNILLRFVQKNGVSVNDVACALRTYYACVSVANMATSQSNKKNRNRRSNNHKKNPTPQGAKIADDLLKLFACARVHRADSVLDLNAVYSSSLAYLASSALIQLMTFALNNHKDGHANAAAAATQIVRYVCHSTVMYKLACIAQLDCVQLDATHEIRNTQQLRSIENEFEMLELITRHLASVKADRKTSTTSMATRGDYDPNVEKQALLKILDCIGLLLRFSESVYVHRRRSRSASVEQQQSMSPMDCDDDVELVTDSDEYQWSIERLLMIILKVLANITNAWNVTLKPNTVRSIFYLFTHFNASPSHSPSHANSTSNYQFLLLMLGVLINCCEKNKNFRNRINEYRMDELTVIEYLIRCFTHLRASIIDIENNNSDALEPLSEANENDDDGKRKGAGSSGVAKLYMQHKVITYYICLLLGFLLQNTEHFKYIALRMKDLSVIVYTLQQFFQFQQELNPNHHTLIVIVQVIKIVNLRNEALKNILNKNAEKQRQKIMENESQQKNETAH